MGTLLQGGVSARMPALPSRLGRSKQPKELLEEFFGVSLRTVSLPPDELISKSEIKFLTWENLQELVIERPPFLLLERTVSIGDAYMLATAAITPERCLGHFPGHPVVPLIRMCEATAQAGMVLVALNMGRGFVPVAMASGESRTLTKKFTEPPVTLVIEARKVRERRGVLYVVDGKIHANGEEIAVLSGIKYMVLPREYVVPTGN